MKLSDQVVLVTGAGRGLGAAIAAAFVREGARVIVNYRRSADAANSLVGRLGARALAQQGDVTERGDVNRIVAEARQKFGHPITTVVNNALGDYRFMGDARPRGEVISWNDFDGQFVAAVRGALNTIQATFGEMATAKFGRIINIGTNLFQNPVVPYHDYTAAKAAVLSLTRTMAVELGPSGITVNMVSGGLLRKTDASAATPDSVFDFVASITPLGRVTTPEEFADTVLFFASPWARSVTGQNLVVDGGLVKN
jgi:3-oxoacyl-[acyl-carrier protein] reductase